MASGRSGRDAGEFELRVSGQSNVSAQTRSVSVQSALRNERVAALRNSLRKAACAANSAQDSGRKRRQSLVADGGVPMDVLELERDGRTFFERMRALSLAVVTKVRKAVSGSSLGHTLLVVLTIGTLLTYHFLAKVIFGSRAKEEQPNKFVLIALTRLLSSGLYLAISRLGMSWEECRSCLVERKVWLICAPYAVGLLAVYVTAMMALEFVALSARNAIMQGRLLLDLCIGSFLLGAPVTRQKVVGVLAIIGAVATSMLTVKQSAASKDPTTGMLIMLLNNGISSSTYAYFPFVLPRYKVSPTICSFVCAVEILFLCSICIGVEAASEGMAVFNGFQAADALLVLAISLTDTCYFFLPIVMPPIVLTLCVTSTIPCGYFLENVYFGMPIEPLTAVAMLTVGLSTIAYVVSTTTKGPKADEKEEAKDAEHGEDPEARLSHFSASSGFCNSSYMASEGCELPTGEVARQPAFEELAWEKLAAQFQAQEDEDLDVLSEYGFQPTLLNQRYAAKVESTKADECKPAISCEDGVLSM